MKRWDSAHDGKIYDDIQVLENPALSLYALESYAIIVDSIIQNELLRNLILSPVSYTHLTLPTKRIV